ncbi:hypothetical protein [Chitinophaga rhizophila]|uniref:Outer membrane protein beta-barrel domain-containing protein n=1 Tax=Chitinophaga rhizophila TaxID=2866212 RepID=A0ABS7GKP7_9BACT|nr:hypothetical protein [Chitinophaga rhizophila]MBW8688298.1 hypothetical protein [Chitinophaga rhizophila]
MKKFFLLAAFCLTGITVTHAQRFIHGVGTGVFIDGSDRTTTKASTVLTYSPRFSFAETANTSVSVGIPLNVGVNGSAYYVFDGYEDYYEETSLGFMLNAPLMVNFNFGAGSSAGNKSRVGFFVGAGYGVHVGTTVYESYFFEGRYYESESHTETTTGPAGNIGIRIAVGAKKRHNIEINTFYMKGMSAHKPHIGGLTGIFNF